MKEKDVSKARAGIEQFAAERVELMILIIMMAIMISVIDPTFRLLMYLIIAVAVIIIGYNYYLNLKKPEEPRKKEREVLISTKP
jgi:membrane protein implicated in regulation of membrane protease activity